MPAQIPKEEEKKIADDLRAGKKPDQIHRETGRGKSVIYRIMDSIGLSNSPTGPTVRTKIATETKMDYDRQRQIDLGNKFFNRIDELMDEGVAPSDLRSLTIAYGVIVDKRALLDGRPTGSLDVNVSGKSIDERLTELAARRAERQRAADP